MLCRQSRINMVGRGYAGNLGLTWWGGGGGYAGNLGFTWRGGGYAEVDCVPCSLYVLCVCRVFMSHHVRCHL